MPSGLAPVYGSRVNAGFGVFVTVRPAAMMMPAGNGSADAAQKPTGRAMVMVQTALDPTKAGGDPYDLADIGVTHARYVRIHDKTTERCTSQGPNTNGFDLDAVAAVHAEIP